MKTSYKPISCDFHDILEDAAVKRLLVDVVYQDDQDHESTVTSKIKDITVEGQEEFLILNSGEKIRLDRLVSVNHQDRADFPA